MIEKNGVEFSNADIRGLHTISTLIASMYAAAYEGNLPQDIKENLLTAYRSIRRIIPENPATGKRFGASMADDILHGKLD